MNQTTQAEAKEEFVLQIVAGLGHNMKLYKILGRRC
jgi:hypothetical protein